MTYRCNHSCKFCSCPWYAPKGHYPKGPEMDARQWCAAIDRLYDLGVESFSISGGECLLHPGLEEVLFHLKGEGKRRGLARQVVLISNGLLMSEEHLCLFKECNVHLSMSLPGLETFAYHTGRDNVEGVLLWFQRARELGLATTCNVTVTRANLHELYETLAVALLNGAHDILLNRFLPGGRGLSHQGDLALSNDDLNTMLDTAEQVLAISRRRGHVGTEIPFCAIRDPGRYRHLSIGYQCAAAREFMVIDPAGQVRTCNHSPRVVGQVLGDEIISDLEYWDLFAKGTCQPGFCQGCREARRCDCGCREVASILRGSPCEVDPTLMLRPLPATSNPGI